MVQKINGTHENLEEYYKSDLIIPVFLYYLNHELTLNPTGWTSNQPNSYGKKKEQGTTTFQKFKRI